LKLSKVIARIEERFPKVWMEDWDFAGLLVGDLWADIERILLALDPTHDVVNEAADKGVDLLITHHPPGLTPPSNIVKGDADGGTYYEAVKANLALYVLHTAWDVSRVSPSFAIAGQLDLLDPSVLFPTDKGKLLKLAVFVPDDHLDAVREAITSAGAGHIGNYSDCTFSAPGEGTFRPGSGTKPYSGKTGELKREKERRLETIVPTQKLTAVIGAMLKAHPYEEVAYDIYALENAPGQIGIGAVGDLPRPMTIVELAQTLKGILPAANISACGKSETRISRVAVIGGSGGDYIDHVRAKGADALITGEMKYHQLRQAEALGITVILAGHFATEWVGLPLLKSELEKAIWEKPGEGIIEIASAEHGPLWNV